MHDVIGLNVAVSVAGCVCVCGLLTVMFVLYAAQDLQHNDDLICCKQNCSGITTKVEICRDDQADVFDWFNTKPNYLSKWDDHRRRSPGLGWSMGYMKHSETMGGSKPTSAEKDRANVMVFLLGQVWARIQNCKAYF